MQSPFGYVPQPPKPKRSSALVIALIIIGIGLFGGCELALMMGVFEPADHAMPLPRSSAPAPSASP